jgi:Methyltransferase domain
MGETINEIRNRLWQGQDPFADPMQGHATDKQGWGGSEHPFLSSGIEQLRPRVVIEVGVWKGASVIFMAKKLRELGLDAVVIAIDTWLGSVENWTNPAERPGIKLTHGYPQLYFTFAANIISEGLQDYVVPLPLDSVNARHLISRSGIVSDMIHIDGGHDYQSVTTDLTQWWPVLRSGGLYVGDDYHPHWVEVVKATDDFFKANPPRMFQTHPPKCAAVKA